MYINEKARDFFKNNAGYIVVILISAVYLLSSFVTIGNTGKTIAEIISNGAIVFLLGIFINRIFDLQGILNGERSDKFISTLTLHGEMVCKIAPYMDKLDEWCEIKNEEALKMRRIKILAQNGIKYNNCFEEDGTPKPFSIDKEKIKDKLLRKSEINRMKSYNKAVRLKLTPLSASALTSEGGKTNDPYYLGQTKAQYEAKRGVNDIFSKIATACLFGYYGVELVKEFDYSLLIWTSLQIGMFLLMGVIKMNQSYLFITEEYRGRIIKKIDNLQKFDNYINNRTEDYKEKNIEKER